MPISCRALAFVGLLCAWGLSLGSSLVWAQQGFLMDRSTEWLIFDASTKRYVPFLPDFQGPSQTLHLSLEAPQKMGGALLIWLDSGTYVFEDNGLKYHIGSERCLRLALDTLSARQLSIWRQDVPWASPPPVWQVRSGWQPQDPPRALSDGLSDPPEALALRPVWLTDPLIALTWAMFLMIALLKQADALIFSGKSMRLLLEAFYKPIPELQRLGTITGLLFFLYYALGASYLISLLSGETSVDLWWFFGHSFWWCLVISSLHLLGLLLFSQLYVGSTQLGWVHFREYMQLTLPLLSGALLVVFLLTLGRGRMGVEAYVSSLTFILVGGVIVRSLLLCYQIFRYQRGLNLYLFSYLCSVEIIPAFFLVQFFLRF
ncbi:MAG: hypothetical protein ACFCUI_01260 [Bernardetiaceae bacterium]